MFWIDQKIQFHCLLLSLFYTNMKATKDVKEIAPHFEELWRLELNSVRKNFFLIAVVAYTTSQNDQDLLKRWLPRAIDELSLTAVEEIILQTLLFSGFPRTIEALTTLRSNYPAAGVSTDPGELRQKGLELSRLVYGKHHPRLIEIMNQLQPDLTRWMIEDGYGRVLSRPGLDLMEREIAVLTVLMASGMQAQFRAHFRGALNVGIKEVDIIWFTNTFNCIIAADLRETFLGVVMQVLKSNGMSSIDRVNDSQ